MYMYMHFVRISQGLTLSVALNLLRFFSLLPLHSHYNPLSFPFILIILTLFSFFEQSIYSQAHVL